MRAREEPFVVAHQVKDALGFLLQGFEAAAERDGATLLVLDDPLAPFSSSSSSSSSSSERLYGGLLTVLLRLVFLLYAEDRDLLPTQQPLYANRFSVLSLFEELQTDFAAHPDTMARRFDAWPRLLAVFRAVYFGLRDGELVIPARRGQLFDPHEHPFLEGWGPSGSSGSAPVDADDRAAARVPTIDDGTVFAVLHKLLVTGGQRLSYRELDVEQIGSVYETLMGYRILRAPGPSGQLLIQPGAQRRRTSSHYTPRRLAESIVRKTLEPLLLAMGNEPSSEQLLRLKICDPAMGSGAFLVEACRFLADQVVAAWGREGVAAQSSEDLLPRARQRVAQRCLYGVDKNPYAVHLAKLSLWLVTLAKEEPFTFVDHALRVGDSLVGSSLDQITGFHWKPEKQLDFVYDEIAGALDEAAGLRRQILAIGGPHGSDSTEKERLLGDAENAIDRARLIGDLVIGAFFAHEKDKDREKERARRLDLLRRWLEGETQAPEELRAMQAEIRAKIPTFHWIVELPEVFWAGRQEPLPDGKIGEARGMDAFVGNPPFAGKNGVSGMDPSYLRWLQSIHEGAHGNADLSAHFFRRGEALLGSHGTIGLIATNTVAEGDTRSTGLQRLAQRGLVIYDAIRNLPWPGEANVAVAVVCLAKGGVATLPRLRMTLDGARVRAIDSRLRPAPERPDPAPLAANSRSFFPGVTLHGAGFLLTEDERSALIKANPQNALRIFPYLGGEEVNSSPVQRFRRHVISFGLVPLEEAERWPDLLSIVRERVKPERDKLRADSSAGRYRKEHWWQFAGRSADLYEAIRGSRRCLVTSRVTKHLCFSFQPTDRMFSETLCVFAYDEHARFGVMQSRAHEPWARLLSSSMRRDLRYAASDCFATFPFPGPEHLTPDGPLEAIGQRLYEARARYMVGEQVGLTITYNRLKDPEDRTPGVVALRRLHEEMDRAVLAAYGWRDIDVPPCGTPLTDEDRRAVLRFEDEVIGRLFALNAERAEEGGRSAKRRARPEPGRGARVRRS